MPALRADSNKPVHVKVKRSKAKAGPPTPSSRSRPAPKTQPGPISNTEQRKIVRHKKKPTYGKALQKARVHGPATRRGTSPAGDTKGDAETRKGQDYVRKQYERRYDNKDRKYVDPDRPGKHTEFGLHYKPGTTVPPDVETKVAQRKLETKIRVKRASTAVKAAPVLKALEQTTRPLHAVAAAERAIIKGVKQGNVEPSKVVKAAVKGVKNEDKSTASDVLKDLGVKNKVVLGVGGFAGDVVGDPTTYITGGTASVARKAAADAAKNASKRALKAGLTKEQAARMGERAAKQAARKAPDSRGLTVRVGGHEVPGVRRATAKTGRGVRKATDKPKIVRKVKDKARHLAADVNPQIVPDNISRESYREVRRATRTARSTTARQIAKTKDRAVAVKAHVKGADQEILDAIESGSLRKLTPEKRAVAKRLRDQFRYARRLERRAGIPVKERQGYVPHALDEPLRKGEGIQGVGAKVIKPSFAKARKEQRTLAEIRTTDPGKYSEDAALLYANRVIESHVATNKATLNRRLLDMGRRVRKGDEVHVGEGEKVFNVKGSNIREITEKRELQRFLDDGDGGRGGQYVVLNEQVVDRAVKNVVPQSERTAMGRTFDRVQGGWKWLATVPNLGFHVRNAVGDAQNAYLAEAGHKVAANTVKSFRTLKRVGKEEEQLRKALPGAPAELKGKGVKVDGKKVSYHDLIQEAEGVGAIRAGFINRELPELTSGKPGVKKIRKGVGKAGRPGRSLKRFIQNREDLFRLATYIGARNRGLTPEKAAERAARYHFDYADLTQLERTVLRRVAPFYTFSARNIPLQLTSYMTKPGKFAQYQKIREEAAKAFGVDLDKAEGGMTEYEQRSAPVVVKWKGHDINLSFGPSGLPLTDLNEMPVGADPTKWADEWFQRATSLLSPAIKSPLEYGMNYSFFFRDQLERNEGPLVPAPSFVGKLPEGLRRKLGIVSDYVDKRTGKKGWGWPAKTDYIANTLAPGPGGLIKRVATNSDRPGEGTGTKLVAGAGLRVRKVDPASAKLSRVYDEKAKLTKQRSAMNQRGINGDNPSPAWRKLSDEIRVMEKEIERLRHKRGDKIVPGRGRPKKIKAPEFVGAGGGVQWVDAAGDVEWVP